jgi:phosphoglycolate phosphatase-like HAD superfamily hydrolase
MFFDAAVFDFDGTLVDSARAKRDAFFAIFPNTPEHRRIVSGVLEEDPDGSRHRVIPLMIERMRAAGLEPGAASSAGELVARYGSVSADAVRNAPELPGASVLLAKLSLRMQLHLCSNTPETTVRAHVEARGWTSYFATVSGHPAEKRATVAAVLRGGHFRPERVAVIGDGISDEEAARANDCAFIAVRGPADLAAAARILGVSDV